MVFGERPVMPQENAPAPPDPALQEFVYELLVVPHWITRAVGLAPPVAVTLPLPVADVVVMPVTALVETVGIVTGMRVVKEDCVGEV